MAWTKKKEKSLYDVYINEVHETYTSGDCPPCS